MKHKTLSLFTVLLAGGALIIPACSNLSSSPVKEADEQLNYEERLNRNPKHISEENRYSLDFKPNYDKGGEEYSG